MIKLTDTIRKVLGSALKDGTPCLLGTSTKDGHPQISPKGSVVVFDDETLCYWERSNRSALKRIEAAAPISLRSRRSSLRSSRATV